MRPAQITGVPDFYFPLRRLAVFVDGCFWHGCPRCGHIPKANRSYWSQKLARNKRRDARVGRDLRANGIRVVRIWECRLRDESLFCMRRLSAMLARPPILPP
jgi:DNA mismatch endonuclease Vsr